MRINLYKLGYTTYNVAISFDDGVTTSHHFSAFTKTAVQAAEQCLNTLGYQLPQSGTLLIYCYPVVHKLPWEAPNNLELVMDYKQKELFFIPWSLHANRTNPRWCQRSLFEPNGSQSMNK